MEVQHGQKVADLNLARLVNEHRLRGHDVRDGLKATDGEGAEGAEDDAGVAEEAAGLVGCLREVVRADEPVLDLLVEVLVPVATSATTSSPKEASASQTSTELTNHDGNPSTPAP